MLTLTSEVTQARLRTGTELYFVVVLLAADGTTYLISDRTRHFDDAVGFNCYGLLISSPSIKNSFNVMTNQFSIADVSLTFSNRPFMHSSGDQPGLTTRLSDLIGDNRFSVATIYLCVGADTPTLTTDGVIVFRGMVTDYPKYDDKQMTLRLTDSTKKEEVRLPKKTMLSEFPASPSSVHAEKVPLVYGSFFSGSDTVEKTGLARCVRKTQETEAKFIVSDHELYALTKSFTKAEVLDDVSEFQDSTYNTADAGNGSVTLGLNSDNYIELKTRVRPIDNFSGTYDQTVADNDVTNFSNAIDGKIDTYAELLDYTDTGDYRLGHIMFAFPDVISGGYLNNDLGRIFGPAGYIAHVIEYRVVADDSTMNWLADTISGEYYPNAQNIYSRYNLTDQMHTHIPVLSETTQSANITWSVASSGKVGSVTFSGSGNSTCNITGTYVGEFSGEYQISTRDVQKGKILTVADGGTGKIIITSDVPFHYGSGYITLSGTTDYNGYKAIDSLSDNYTMTLDETWVDNQTGEWIMTSYKWDSLDPAFAVHGGRMTSSSTVVLTDGLTAGFGTEVGREPGDGWTFPVVRKTDLRDVFAWHFRQNDFAEEDDQWPLVAYFRFATDVDANNWLLPSNGVARDETLLKFYDCALVVTHDLKRINNMFVECEGRKYGSWITGRGSNYSVGDSITDASGIIEDILRNELGYVSSDLDLESFIEAENTDTSARINLHSLNYELPSTIFRSLSEQSFFTFLRAANGQFKLASLRYEPATVDRVIKFAHLTGVPKCSQSSTLINRILVDSRYRQEIDGFEDHHEYNDTTSQVTDDFGVWSFTASWKNICGDTRDLVCNWLINSTNGLWSRPHLVIEFETYLACEADLQVADWISLEHDTGLDRTMLIQGESWQNKKFVIYDTAQTIKGTKFRAINLPFGTKPIIIDVTDIATAAFSAEDASVSVT